MALMTRPAQSIFFDVGAADADGFGIAGLFVTEVMN
jgi:hypothetical protein